MGNKINININDLISENVDIGTSLMDIAKDYKKITGKSVVGARINNIICDLDTVVTENTDIEFFDYTDPEGNKMYQSLLKFIMIFAVRELWGVDAEFKYSIDKGIYVKIDKKLSNADVLELKIKMKQIIDDDYVVKKCLTRRKDAIIYYLSIGSEEKAHNINNLPTHYVQLYELNHLYNYFYSDMPLSTGVISLFNIELINKNAIVLMYPRVDSGGLVPVYNYNEKIFNVLNEYSNWSEKMNVKYVDGINQKIADGTIEQFIKMNNIYVDDSLYIIAKNIVKTSNKVKLILIGGPSSSGKTTSAHKLKIYLETFGLKPIVISADDYFKNRVDTPKDEFGNYDYERLDAIDLELFNEKMSDLLSGKETILPSYNFITGEKEYKNKPIKLKPNNILLIEGLHCLNDKMTESIKRENKYKIFVCPFTPLGLDRHNHLSTTDMRLIRRIVRDNRTRGVDAEHTLENWAKVREGEEKYIFPYINDEDAVLNTAYAYEMGILKVYVEPLLYNVPMHSIYYEHARRLLGLLKTFYPISSEYIENDNTLREFIGGSIYEK